jgi:hypothetical protein
MGVRCVKLVVECVRGGPAVCARASASFQGVVRGDMVARATVGLHLSRVGCPGCALGWPRVGPGNGSHILKRFLKQTRLYRIHATSCRPQAVAQTSPPAA